jgi:hypothetical protein
MLGNSEVFAFFAAFCEKWRGFTEDSKGSKGGFTGFEIRAAPGYNPPSLVSYGGANRCGPVD